MIQHPVTKQTILTASNFHKRKRIADTLHKKYKWSQLEFANQSICKLSRLHFEMFVGQLPEDTYGPEQLDILQNYSVVPVVINRRDVTLPVSDEPVRFLSIDMRQSYTSGLLHNKERIPVFSFSDRKQRYDSSMGLPIGEFYINCQVRMA
jgi:hypothetical protein